MIIADLNMPRMNGVELAKRAKQVGISTFLRKPVSESQLGTILNVVLGA